MISCQLPCTNSSKLKKMAYNYVINDLPIFKAALRDDWDCVARIFQDDPEKMTKQITYWWETPLVIAVGTNRSHRFVKQLVERIVLVGAADRLWTTSYGGNNPLHYAAKVGNTIDARILVEQKPEMTLVPNPHGDTPLKLAARHGHKETLRYLLEVTRDLSPGEEENNSPYTGKAGGDLITLTITAGFFDVALEIIERYPNIVIESDKNGETALEVLAAKPDLFPSGMQLGFWRSLIYSMMPVESNPRPTVQRNSQSTTNPFFKGLQRVGFHLNADFWSTLQYVAPGIKDIHDKKVAHVQVNGLLKCICTSVMERVDHDLTWKMFGTSIATAVKYGIHELIEECVRVYPSVVTYNINGFNLFIEAIKQRQERVYNLHYQLSGHKVFASEITTNDGENALHIAARLAPFHRLNTVTGAALQMQRELQWFKEVEKFVEPSYKDALNYREARTPRMVFTDEHMELLKQGEEWMKTTASSCTVVAALVVTMAFAAAFTTPGGNEGDGKPVYLNERNFMLFVISDAIALFSSATSVLIFLAVLTARYAEEDFLYFLHKRMTMGLLFLFLSVAATMIAFSATLALVLRDKVTWIAAPLTLIACIPVTVFIYLEFHLLVELVSSTWKSSIFGPQSNELLH